MSPAAATSSTPVPYAEALSRYEAVLGLEVHVELSTASKMFCGCEVTFGAEPNTRTCPVCLGLPGSMPVANEAAVRGTALIGLALGCDVAERCRFARKNYFYPDIPKNFQISQYDEPLCADGHLDVEITDGDGAARTARVEVERVHLEEDTGTSRHVGGAGGRISGATESQLDFNRSGTPLVEVVSRPVAGTGTDVAAVARAYVQALRDVVVALGVSDARMDQGSMRCDVNLSLNRAGEGYGTRTETKNLNSTRSVERAVRAEVERQAALLDAGERVVLETRHFDEASGTSRPGRSKETADDYRYFPEPDLVPLQVPREDVERWRLELPEAPAVRRRRLAESLGLHGQDLETALGAGVLEPMGATVEAGAAPEAARAWWLSWLPQQANERGVEPAALPVTPADVARVCVLVGEGALTTALARQALTGVLDGEGDVDAVVTARGLAVEQDIGALDTAVDEAIAAQPGPAQKVRDGNDKAVGPLVGAVMKATQGKADAARVRQLLLDRLAGAG